MYTYATECDKIYIKIIGHEKYDISICYFVAFRYFSYSYFVCGYFWYDVATNYENNRKKSLRVQCLSIREKCITG